MVCYIIFIESEPWRQLENIFLKTMHISDKKIVNLFYLIIL